MAKVKIQVEKRVYGNMEIEVDNINETLSRRAINGRCKKAALEEIDNGKQINWISENEQRKDITDTLNKRGWTEKEIDDFVKNYFLMNYEFRVIDIEY